MIVKSLPLFVFAAVGDVGDVAAGGDKPSITVDQILSQVAPSMSSDVSQLSIFSADDETTAIDWTITLA